MFYRFLLLILIISSPIFLTACAKSEQNNSRQVPAVLLGTDCGFDKLKCCATTPACNYGQQCCVDPNNVNINYCSEDCSCGNNEEFCCAGNKCNGNAVCVNGICSACGAKDQVCCTDATSCLGGLVCSENKCLECGLSGEPCCEGANSCLRKAGEKAECLNNFCQNCGFDGNPPCTTGDKCLPGQIFTGKNCERCGQNNQPCCSVASSTSYACDSSASLKCELGFCAIEN